MGALLLMEWECILWGTDDMGRSIAGIYWCWLMLKLTLQSIAIKMTLLLVTVHWNVLQRSGVGTLICDLSSSGPHFWNINNKRWAVSSSWEINTQLSTWDGGSYLDICRFIEWGSWVGSQHSTKLSQLDVYNTRSKSNQSTFMQSKRTVRMVTMHHVHQCEQDQADLINPMSCVQFPCKHMYILTKYISGGVKIILWR